MSSDSQDTLSQAEGQQTALKMVQREVAILLAACQALRSWGGFQRGSERLLHDLAEALDQTAGALWLPEQDVLVARATWSAPSLDRAALEPGAGDVAPAPSHVCFGPARSRSAFRASNPALRSVEAVSHPMWKP